MATSVVQLIEETFLQGLLPEKVVVLRVLDVVGPQIVEGGATQGCEEESKVMGRDEKEVGQEKVSHCATQELHKQGPVANHITYDLIRRAPRARPGEV